MNKLKQKFSEAAQKRRVAYQNRISNLKLKEGEMYCISCNQVIKKIHLNRHDNSLKHEKEVLKFVERMKSKDA